MAELLELKCFKDPYDTAPHSHIVLMPLSPPSPRCDTAPDEDATTVRAETLLREDSEDKAGKNRRSALHLQH